MWLTLLKCKDRVAGGASLRRDAHVLRDVLDVRGPAAREHPAAELRPQLLLLMNGPISPVTISSVLSGGNLVMSGRGPAGGSCVVLSSTDLALPLPAWTRLATNLFDANGNFVFTNAVNPGATQSFYVLQLFNIQ